MKIKSVAVIVAAGAGRRMGGTVKKQYLEIMGKPVLFYTLKAFEDSNIDEIIVVTGQDEIEYVRREIVGSFGLKKVKAVCAGGNERFDSVYEGLKQAKEGNESTDKYVLVHDGVRPLIKPSMINRIIEKVQEKKACVPAVPVKDTIKEVVDGKVTRTFDRKLLYQIQTPQAFDFEMLYQAYEKMYRDIAAGQNDVNIGNPYVMITDDAMLVEHYTDTRISIVEGDYRNIKITTPEDMVLAEAYLKK